MRFIFALRNKKVFGLILVFGFALATLFVIFYFRPLPIPDFLSETKLEDRCPLKDDQTHRICVAEGKAFQPLKDLNRQLRKGDLVLVKARPDRYIAKNPEKYSLLSGDLYQVCMYSALFPSKGKQLSEKYTAGLAFKTFLFGQGYYVYCSKPTALSGYEAKAIGTVTRVRADGKSILGGIWLIPKTNFSDMNGFLKYYPDRLSLFYVSRDIEK